MSNVRIPHRADTVMHELEEQGEAVIYDADGNQLIVLNGMGAAVWHLMDGKRSVGDIEREIVDALAAKPADVERDVSAFLSSLEERGLVEFR
jgi:hypothetical protein